MTCKRNREWAVDIQILIAFIDSYSAVGFKIVIITHIHVLMAWYCEQPHNSLQLKLFESQFNRMLIWFWFNIGFNALISFSKNKEYTNNSLESLLIIVIYLFFLAHINGIHQHFRETKCFEKSRTILVLKMMWKRKTCPTCTLLLNVSSVRPLYPLQPNVLN